MKAGVKKYIAAGLVIAMCTSVYFSSQKVFAQADPAGQNVVETQQESSDGAGQSREPTDDERTDRITKRTVRNDVITKIEALLQNGGGPVETVSQWQVFMLRAYFSLPDDQVKEGDTTVVKLPDELRFYTEVPFDIKDDDGNLVAKAVVDGEAKTITLTYTDYPEKHSGVSGKFNFFVRIDRNVVTEETEIPLVFDVSGKTVIAGSVHYEGPKDPTPRIISKSGAQVKSEDPRHLRYVLKINTQKTELRNIVVTDNLLTDGVYYDKDSIEIRKGKWENVNGDWTLTDEQDVTGSYTINWGDDGQSFSVALGNLAASEGIQIRYNATSDYDFADGEVIRNTAKITGCNIESKTSSETVTYSIAGGSAEGYVYRIKIHKQDKEGKALAGAVFNVVRKANGMVVGTITTNAEGEGELAGLLKGEYDLVETEAPAGYKLLEEPVMVTADDFNDDRVAEKTIENSVETRSIPVTKKWVGTAADSAGITLYADGEVKEKVILTESNNWQHQFTDLPVYTSDGTEIKYTISEDDMEGYTSQITGDAESGFVVTNTKKDEPPDKPDQPKPENSSGKKDNVPPDKTDKTKPESSSEKTSDTKKTPETKDNAPADETDKTSPGSPSVRTTDTREYTQPGATDIIRTDVSSEKTPATGDETDAVCLILTLILSSGALAGLLLRRKMIRNKRG